MQFADIGQQLRAYRLESGLRAEEIAARLGVSRAALYRYEKGEVIKLDTIRRLAELLKISPLSLLGIGVEYFSRPLALGERLRQVEEVADQMLQVGGALCLQVTTDALDGALAEIFVELADASDERVQARSVAEQALAQVSQRKRLYAQRRPSIIAMLGEGSLRAMLRQGIGGTLPLSERMRARCLLAARAEAERIADLMQSDPMGLQIGLLPAGDPAGNFLVLRDRERAHLCANPFPPDASPFGAIGVGMITGADEAVAIHQRVAEAVWRDAIKGPAGAERVRALIRDSEVV